MFLGPNEAHRTPPSRPISSLTRIVLFESVMRILGNTHIEGKVGTFEDVNEEHRKAECPSARPKEGLARDKISLCEILEAGGVEPPSEKRNGQKTTCLAPFGLVRPLRLEGARNTAG